MQRYIQRLCLLLALASLAAIVLYQRRGAAPAAKLIPTVGPPAADSEPRSSKEDGKSEPGAPGGSASGKYDFSRWDPKWVEQTRQSIPLEFRNDKAVHDRLRTIDLVRRMARSQPWSLSEFDPADVALVRKHAPKQSDYELYQTLWACRNQRIPVREFFEPEADRDRK